MLDCLGENLNGYQELTRKLKEKKYKENDIIGKKIKWNKNILKGWCGFFCNLRADVDT